MNYSNMITEEYIGAYRALLNKTMRAFIAFCQEYGLTYFVCGGTALGVVRHQGIIPWDEDIDVYMKREDYDRFISLHKILAEGGKYHILSKEIYPEYRSAFAKFCDSHSSMLHSPNQSLVYGMYIDVFPLDRTDKSISHKDISCRYLDVVDKHFRATMYADLSIKALLRHLSSANVGALIDNLKLKVCRIFASKYYKEYIALTNQIRGFEGDYLYTSAYGRYPDNKIFPKEWFEGVEMLPFEDYEVAVPKGLIEYLTAYFGPNYMIPPGKEEQDERHHKYYANIVERLNRQECERRVRQGENYVY